MIQKLQVIIILLIIPLGALYLYTEHKGITLSEFFFEESTVMHIGDIPLHVDVANTDASRQRGLSGTEELAATNGMLFIFEESDYHGIWMKDMKYSIDVIWINEDLEVIGVTENLTPDSYPRVFEPPQRALYAVETNEHFAESFGIRVGDTVTLPLNYR